MTEAQGDRQGDITRGTSRRMSWERVPHLYPNCLCKHQVVSMATPKPNQSGTGWRSRCFISAKKSLQNFPSPPDSPTALPLRPPLSRQSASELPPFCLLPASSTPVLHFICTQIQPALDLDFLVSVILSRNMLILQQWLMCRKDGKGEGIWLFLVPVCSMNRFQSHSFLKSKTPTLANKGGVELVILMPKNTSYKCRQERDCPTVVLLLLPLSPTSQHLSRTPPCLSFSLSC